MGIVVVPINLRFACGSGQATCYVACELRYTFCRVDSRSNPPNVHAIVNAIAKTCGGLLRESALQLIRVTGLVGNEKCLLLEVHHPQNEGFLLSFSHILLHPLGLGIDQA